ncbi:Pentatricopeptide repeat-containing protein At5g02860 [Durusdinium trenchii]|uniref:Pentatricopeptide repeat-containing protein At5g02860 n=1 Tax=Durusdinium trenchii TaxID=1381693 RepID=A0ABP0PS54_9DINO
MCGKTLCWNRSLSLTASLTRSRLRPTASTIGGLLTAFERGGYWVAALSKLSLTREQPAWLYGAKGGEVSVTWNAGVAACASSAAWEWAAKLVRGEPWRGVSTKAVGTAGYNAAMAACGNWVVAMELLRQLLRSGGRPRLPGRHCECMHDNRCLRHWPGLVRLPSTHCRRIIFCGISAAGAEGAWEVSMTLMSEAALALVEFDVAVYNAALSVLAGNDRWQATLQLRQRLQAAGLKETAGTVNPVAVAAGRGSSWASAVTALEEEHCQDAAALGAAITASAQGSQWIRCLHLLSLPMLQSESALATYNALITVLGEQALHDKTMQLLGEAVKLTLRPSIVTFNAAMDVTSASGWLGAVALLEALRSQTLESDAFTYYYAIGACEGSSAAAPFGRSLVAEALPILESRAAQLFGSRLIILDQIRALDFFTSALEEAYRSAIQPVVARLRLLCAQKTRTNPAATRLMDNVLANFFGLEGSLTQETLQLISNVSEADRTWVDRGRCFARHSLQGSNAIFRCNCRDKIRAQRRL